MRHTIRCKVIKQKEKKYKQKNEYNFRKLCTSIQKKQDN